MTAPLRSGDPIVVNVALGPRAYDIVIGRGLLASLGARVAAGGLSPARQKPETQLKSPTSVAMVGSPPAPSW